jgi:hypothetical protein
MEKLGVGGSVKYEGVMEYFVRAIVFVTNYPVIPQINNISVHCSLSTAHC